MNRARILLGYLIGFIGSILIATFGLIIIAKITIYNKNYIKKSIKENKYTEKMASQILQDMQNYMVSSGLPESVLDGIYTKKDIDKYVNSYIDSYYVGKIIKVDNTSLKNKLKNNINNYFDVHNLEITNDSHINSFVSEISSIYEKELGLYGILDGEVRLFNKLGDLINIAFVINMISLLIVFGLMKILKANYKGSVVLSGGLILLFIRFIILSKIDYKNVLIISSSFSDFLKLIINKLNNYLLSMCILYMVLGFFLVLIGALSKKHLEKY